MKLIRKNIQSLIMLFFIGLLIGSLFWELLERVFILFGADLSLSTGPIGFDISVISFSLKLNPGSFLGIGGGIILFRVIK